MDRKAIQFTLTINAAFLPKSSHAGASPRLEILCNNNTTSLTTNKMIKIAAAVVPRLMQSKHTERDLQPVGRETIAAWIRFRLGPLLFPAVGNHKTANTSYSCPCSD